MSDAPMPSHTAVNPFAAPRADNVDSAYYRTDVSKLTFAEIWRTASPNPLFLAFAAIVKILRLKGAATNAAAYDDLRIVELPDVPPQVIEAVAGQLAECEAKGFVRRFAGTIPTLGDLEVWNVILSNRERTVLAEVLYDRIAQRTQCIVSLGSLLRDGRLMMTMNMKHTIDMPEEMLIEYLCDAPVAQLAQAHADRLAQMRHVAPVVLDEVAQRQLLLDSTHRTLEFQRARGVWVPISTADAARLQS